MARVLRCVIAMIWLVCDSHCFRLSVPLFGRRFRTIEAHPFRFLPNLCPYVDAKRGRAISAAGMLRMQSTDPQWYAFQGFNVGTWAGTSIHIDPCTGDYAQPYIIRKYTLQVNEVKTKQGGDSAVEKLVAEATKTLPPLETTKIIAPDDDFDATPDGAYSLDRREVKVADTGLTASLVVEMSLPMSDNERVRCEVVYNSEYKLSLIVLHEEGRQVATSTSTKGSGGVPKSKTKLLSKLGAGEPNSAAVLEPAPAASVRAPLELMDIVGTLTEQVSSRRSWRLGGGFIKYSTKTVLSYDGDTRVRRVSTASAAKGATDPELTTVKWGQTQDTPSDVTWRGTQAFSKVIDFDDGRMVLLPSGCWVKAPSVLTKKDGSAIGKLSLLDILSPDQKPEDAAKVVDGLLGTKDLDGDLDSFFVEFGVYGGEEELKHCRTSRLYGEDGRLSSTALAFEM